MHDLYYRPSIRNSKKSFKGNKAKYTKLLYPVFALGLVVLLLWGAVKVIGTLMNSGKTDFDISAPFYIAEGMSAQKQNFGSNQFLPVLSGDMVFEGDQVRTLENTRGVLVFFNGVIVRLDENTNVQIEEIENKKKDETIRLKVLTGRIWVNKPKSLKLNSNLYVATNYFSAKATGTVFSVKAGLPESLFVVEGNVLASIIDMNLDKDGNKIVIDQINVGPEKQLNLSNDDYQSFVRRETPRVLVDIEPKTRESGWFKWNEIEDGNPTSFTADPMLRSETDYIEQASEDDMNNLEDLFAEGDSSEDSNLENDLMPKFTYPAEGDVISEERIEILGSAPEGAYAIEVISFNKLGEPDPYILKGFKPGDSTFKYIAVYDPFQSSNLLEGINKFEAISINENGERSKTARLEFMLKLANDSEISTSNTLENDDEATSNSTLDIDKLEYSASLPAPVLKAVNDVPAESGFVLRESRGVVDGEIGTWAKSVVVNGFKLQQYEPFSGKFSYILSEGFNTLKKGENKLLVYGFDENGTRGVPATFIINWEP